ncbi:47a7455d-f212-4e99-99ce-8d6b9f200221 [Thermothielavioides terrestris]|uniref:Uncharacterized protein n=2 Tax=Thermothielavioides terrestris TaxID=2587410 RepID=G2R701_THETT|nr:uncharacterized protein THITE_160631 [Thermothielavioides terrestris NRRL 8126]AEO67729.1 hypothetical protein THITE_160631 [Thermothielavioides terrestris NRRL 8126]SPQ25855.1 47a7455d-f212-4e99-99ce-8d6b9f200221 [Thermothielavioides terrestris]
MGKSKMDEAAAERIRRARGDKDGFTKRAADAARRNEQRESSSGYSSSKHSSGGGGIRSGSKSGSKSGSGSGGSKSDHHGSGDKKKQ